MQKNTTDKTIFVPLISDGPNTGFKAVPNPDYINPNPPSPSYTLKEIEALAREWANELQVDTVDQLIVSSLLLWLAKREREGRG